MKNRLILALLTMCGLIILGGALIMGGQPRPGAFEVVPTDEGARQHVVVLELNWDAGHRVVSSSEKLTVTGQYITLEMRDRDRGVVARQTQAIPGCQVVYDKADLPTGICGTEVVFTVTLPYRGYFEEWAQGSFTANNGATYTYTVPARPSLDFDEDGFTLIGVVGEEWYDLCPPDPPTLSPLATATAYPTQEPYPLEPTPTCQSTATQQPGQPTLTPRPTPTLLPTPTDYPEQP